MVDIGDYLYLDLKPVERARALIKTEAVVFGNRFDVLSGLLYFHSSSKTAITAVADLVFEDAEQFFHDVKTFYPQSDFAAEVARNALSAIANYRQSKNLTIPLLEDMANYCNRVRGKKEKKDELTV